MKKIFFTLCLAILTSLISGCAKQINQDSFPIVSHVEAEISNNTLVIKSQVSSKSEVLEVGFIICERWQETYRNGCKIIATATESGEFSASISLSMFDDDATVLVIQPYAINEKGISFGEILRVEI